MAGRSPSPMRGRGRSIGALLLSSFGSSAGTIAFTTIVGKFVYDLSGSELDLGLLGLAQFLPAFLLVLVAGTVIDGADRRRVMVAGSVAQAIVVAILAWYVGTRPTSVAPIFALVLLFGVGQAFSAPAMRLLPADMVDAADLPWMIARNSVAGEAGLIAGPVVTAFLYAVDVRLPFVVIAALLVGAAIAITGAELRPDVGDHRLGRGPIPLLDRREVAAEAVQEAAIEPAAARSAVVAPGTGMRDALEGLRFVSRDPIVLGAISLDLFAVLFGGAVALLPAIAKNRLGVGVVDLGWLRAATGIGAGAMTLVLATRPVGRRIGRTLLLVVALFGVFTIVLGLTRSFAVAFLALVVLSGADAVSVFIRATLVPLATPDDKRGRVMAVENVFIGASNELGGFESGVTGQLLGTSGSVVLGGAATLVVAAAWSILFPSLRRLDRFPGVPPP
jgi:MFS family permease